jgi:hypothetical protein
VRTFAYPYGYYNRCVKGLVQGSGFESACAVRNALSSTLDDCFALARLTVTASTPPERVAQWIAGQRASVSSPRQSLRTRAWRELRRVGALADHPAKL